MYGEKYLQNIISQSIDCIGDTTIVYILIPLTDDYSLRLNLTINNVIIMSTRMIRGNCR